MTAYNSEQTSANDATTVSLPAPVQGFATGGCEFDETCCGAVIRNSEALYGEAGAIPSDTLIYRATEIFAALADSTRFKILSALSAGELCVHELVAICDVSQSAVSHQLRLLRDRNLVSARRDGQKVAYRFSDDHVRSLILIGLEHASEREA
jgi:ArsR family transcriptional regulator